MLSLLFMCTGSIASTSGPVVRLPIGAGGSMRCRLADGGGGGPTSMQSEGFFAGTSSFGMSGVNAHAVLCRPPLPPAQAADAQGSELLWQRREMREGVIPIGHPLLLAAAAAAPCVEFKVDIASPRLAWLRDHVVGGRPIVPGAAFLEMAMAACSSLLLTSSSDGMLGLSSVVFSSPCFIPECSAVGESAMLCAEVDLDEGAVKVFSPSPQNLLQRRLHMSAALALIPEINQCVGETQGSSGRLALSTRGVHQGRGLETLTCDAARARLPEPLATSGLYADLAAAGLKYGPALRRLRGVQRAGADSPQPAAVSSVDQLPGGCSYHVADPAALDCMLQLGAAVPEPGADNAARVPASIRLFAAPMARIEAAGPLRCHAARGTPPPAAGSKTSSTFRDHLLVSGQGQVLCALLGLEAVADPSLDGGHRQPAVAEEEELVYEVQWLSESAIARDESSPRAGLQPAAMQIRGTEVLSVAAGMQAMRAAAAASEGGGGRGFRLQAASAAGHSADSCAAAALLGLLRTFNAEHPASGMSAIGPDPWARASRSVSAGVVTRSVESCIPPDAYGSKAIGGVMLTPRLLPSPSPSHTAPFRLVPRPRGALTNLAREPIDVASGPAGVHTGKRKPMAVGTVLVSVKAVGVNFRDVLNVSWV